MNNVAFFLSFFFNNVAFIFLHLCLVQSKHAALLIAKSVHTCVTDLGKC